MKNLFNCLIKKADSQERRIENEIESCLFVAWHDSLPPQKPRIDEQKTLSFSKKKNVLVNLENDQPILNAFPEIRLSSR